MGNICNGNHDREDVKESVDSLSKNFPICQFTLHNNFTVDLVLGTTQITQGPTVTTKDPY